MSSLVMVGSLQVSSDATQETLAKTLSLITCMLMDGSQASDSVLLLRTCTEQSKIHTPIQSLSHQMVKMTILRLRALIFLISSLRPVSYTHLTLPTNREV